MNKLLAGLMTLVVLGTVVVVFGLGALSLMGGIGSPVTSPATQAERDKLLTYGTDFDDWQYFDPASPTQWRWDIADDGEAYVRLRQVVTNQMLVYAFEWRKQIVARAYWLTDCERGSLTTVSNMGSGEDYSLACVGDKDGTTWLRGEALLPSPGRWHQDFGDLTVSVDLSTWEWATARTLTPPPAEIP